MSDFKDINEEIFKLDDVYTKKVSKKMFALLVFAGLCIMIVSTKLAGLELFGAILFCIALGMIVIGMVGIAKPFEMIYCKYTREALVKQIIYFDASDKNVVRTAIKTGNKEALNLISNGSKNNMRAVVYATPSYSYAVFQMQTYVPHQYVPVEDMVICNTCRVN